MKLTLTPSASRRLFMRGIGTLSAAALALLAGHDALIATIQKLGGQPVAEKSLDVYAQALGQTLPPGVLSFGA